ncbi:hypothetical protein HY637_00335 [Candidatus Woesearchaeota archaeon]|nr:hypothetical protein [Candidatus Woesearchaeota archaeon]
MRLIILAFLSVILIASAASAAGLKITEIDFHVDYDDAYTYRVENRDRIDSGSVPPSNNSKIDADLLPGSNITFTVRVENTFQSGGPTIKGVFVTMRIEEIDDGADLEQESFDFDLEPGDDYRYDLKFAIPLDVDATSYNLILEAEGEDKNETSYKTRLDMKMQVKKQSHDLRITKILLDPIVVSCDRKVKLTAEMMNLGPNPETQNALEFKSTSLNINSIDKDLSLESSDEASEEEKTYVKSLNFEVPDSLAAGSYPLFVNLYWKNFVLFDKKELSLVVKDCGPDIKPIAKNESAKTNKTAAIEPKETESEHDSGIAGLMKPSLLISPTLVFVISGALIILIIIVIVVFSRAKPE